MTGLWHFRSQSTGLKINSFNCADLVSRSDLVDVIQEVTDHVQTTKAQLRRAKENPGEVPPERVLHLKRRKRWVGELHQRLLQLQAEARSQERAERFRQNQELESRYPFSRYFQRVVRHEASPEQYQRWINQAKVMQLRDSKKNNPPPSSP